KVASIKKSMNSCFNEEARALLITLSKKEGPVSDWGEEDWNLVRLIIDKNIVSCKGFKLHYDTLARISGKLVTSAPRGKLDSLYPNLSTQDNALRGAPWYKQLF